MATPNSNSPLVKPLRSALRDDSEKTPPASGILKAVQIAEPDVTAQPISATDEVPSRKQFPANVARRLSGRPAVVVGGPQPTPSRNSLVSQASSEALSSHVSASPMQMAVDDPRQSLSIPQPLPLLQTGRRQSMDHERGRLLAQLAEWLQHEREKKERRRSRRVRHKGRDVDGTADSTADEMADTHARASSADSASSEVSLDRLQHIIEDGMASMGVDVSANASSNRGRRPHARSMRHQSMRTAASSDTDYVDGDVLVPGCDAILDNSRTLKYAAEGRAEKEQQAWLGFKNEIIRLAHTLRLKGWRKVPLDGGDTVLVERLSGALTNAVYVVDPNGRSAEAKATETSAGTSTGTSAVRRNQPSKLLLRIYGPQVEHLIDRENELSVLRRLARKKIGPRLLGTFGNGRFEQFFDASTLTAAQMREPATSRQIAKRMRELHDGVELLEQERDGGPNVWRNWDRWLDTVARTATFVDREVAAAAATGTPGKTSGPNAWKHRGFVCGVEWPQFRTAVEKYRRHVEQTYGGRKIRDELIFAHNDTQYGNILRIRPSDKSPLLQPENQHKQLVVIDFEYAAANPLGLEFANHFTEWAYNYHDAAAPHACNTTHYPTPEEQCRFLRAYVGHRPEFPHQSGASTPRFGPLALSLPALEPLSAEPTAETTLSSSHPASSIAEFMLDARAPPGGWNEEEQRHEELVERQVDALVAETRLWRPANSAQWVVWGIVQAKVPGLGGHGDVDGADEDGFDYLAYAQDRALFFWGDAVQMGIVQLEELPAELRPRIKMVAY